MEQLSFFKESGQTAKIPDELLSYSAGFINEEESAIFFQKLINETPWQQKVGKMYDKQVVTPRLTAWFGDPNAFDYNSLGKTKPLEWTTELLQIKDSVETFLGIEFNSVLLNYYRDGNDSVAWHSDNEKVLGPRPTIASVTFGQVRSFDIRHKLDHSIKHSIRLEHGSLLVMKGDLQQHWEHRIAKSTKPMRERLNLTFRVVV